MGAELPRYRFGPLERRGLVAGWRGGQLAAVATSLVLAVGVLRARPTVAGLGIALVGVGLGVTVACWPVGGRTTEQWLPVAGRWSALAVRRRRRYLSEVPRLGSGAGCGGRSRPEPDVPPVLAGCRILQPPVSVGGMRIGVVHDARARTYAAVLAVQSHAFVLLGADDKHRRVDAWAKVLAGLAREGSAVHRVQWVERSLPDDGDAMARYLAEGLTLPTTSPAARSYLDLLSQAAPVTERHDVLLAVSVHAGRSSRAIRGAGGGDEGGCALLVRELQSLEGQLRAADMTVEGTLAPGALAQVLRQAVDRHPRTLVARPPDQSAGGGRSVSSWPWPLASEASWSGYRTDGTCHATYWVAEWPRVDVGPDFLRPLLLQSGARRTVSVTMEPVSPSRAAREVEHARTADVADAELRRRAGFMLTARRRREQEVVAHRETELADGHAQYRFSGYVTVTADSWDELEVAARRVEQAAGQAHLELRRLYGEQDRAFTWTLPLARGLA
jgi:Putative type VII ESX secretion system translocon, EccE